MKPVVKGLLIGCPILLLVAVIAAIVVVPRISKVMESTMADMEKVRAEGREVGRVMNASSSACVGEAMRMYGGSRRKELRARYWLEGCLETSTRDPGFCSDVPPISENMKTATWRMSECTRLGFGGDKGCARILVSIQRYCEKP